MQTTTDATPRRLHAWSLALGALALLLAARAAACGPDLGIPTPDAETWELRDLLTLDTEQRPIPPQQLPDLRLRVALAAPLDRDLQRDPLAPAEPRPDDPHFPTDPLGTLARFDKTRLDQGQDVRLFAVYGRDAHGAWSAPCDPEPSDLLDEEGHLRTFPTSPGDAWPERWQPWSPWAEQHPPQQLQQLRAIAPALAAWAERCADAVTPDDAPARPLGLHALQPEAHAPYLLAFWPQRRKLYLHPLLLDLLADPRPAAPLASDLRTTTQPLTTADLTACTQELAQRCEACDTQAEINQNPATCQRFFPDSSIAADCATLRDQVRDGYALFCVYQVYQNRPTVEACVQRNVGTTCDRQNVPVNSVSTLVQAYGAFNNVSTGALCRDQVAECANPSAPANNTPANNNTPEPEPSACGTPGAAECEEPGFADDCSLCNWCQDDAGDDLNRWCGCDEDEEEDPSSSDDDGCCSGDE